MKYKRPWSFDQDDLKKATEALDAQTHLAEQYYQLFYTDWKALAKKRGKGEGKAMSMFFNALRQNRHAAAKKQCQFARLFDQIMEELKKHPRFLEINDAFPSSLCLYDADESWREAIQYLDKNEPVAVLAVIGTYNAMVSHFMDWLEEARKRSQDGRVDVKEYVSDKTLFNFDALVNGFHFRDTVLSGDSGLCCFKQVFDVISQGLNDPGPIKVPEYRLNVPGHKIFA